MIYFIQCEKTFLVKIGYAGNDPVRRLSALQIGSPSRLHLVAVINGNKEKEKLVHRKFRKYRVRGEWFKPSPEIFSFMVRRLVKSDSLILKKQKELVSVVVQVSAEERLESEMGKRIVDLLKSAGPSVKMWPSEVAEALNESRKDYVRNTLRRLISRGILKREGKRYFYPVNGDIQAQ